MAVEDQDSFIHVIVRQGLLDILPSDVLARLVNSCGMLLLSRSTYCNWLCEKCRYPLLDMSSESSEIREMAAMIVRDYLTGPWKKITPNNIVLQRVSGGLSNWLYRISLPATYQNENERNGEPVQVLLRLHGQVNCENAFERLITESVIFTLLSERELGPRLHGVFPGGRIEEYIPARPLKTKELADPKISLVIAEKMAQVHSMNVPISKEPKWLYDSAAKWLKKVKQELEEFEALDRDTEQFVNKFKSYNLDCELVWLRKFLSKLNSPVVFSHNDMQEGNILIHEPYDTSTNEPPRLVLIDFEYCSYNHRGFDLANHFLEYTYDYTMNDYPNFTVNKSNYPSLHQQLMFIRRYLSIVRNANDEVSSILKVEKLNIDTNDGLLRINDNGDSDVLLTGMNEEEEKVLKEVECFTLASHLMWGIWAAMQAQSQIPFGYWEYCMVRLDSYFELKNKILSCSIDVFGKKRKVVDID